MANRKRKSKIKYIIKCFLIILFITGISLSFYSCKKDTLDKTTWVSLNEGEEFILKFNNQKFSLSADEIEVEGKYSISDITVSLTARHLQSGETLVFYGTLSDNRLVITDNRRKYDFTRK